MIDRAEASDRVRQFMLRLVDHLKPEFPQYAAALSSEIVGNKMTNDRWNHIAAVLASLAALPGKYLRQSEHDARNPALAAVTAAQKMASATFGGRRDDEECLSLAAHIADEILEKMIDGKKEG